MQEKSIGSLSGQLTVVDCVFSFQLSHTVKICQNQYFNRNFTLLNLWSEIYVEVQINSLYFEYKTTRLVYYSICIIICIIVLLSYLYKMYVIIIYKTNVVQSSFL